ncbi:MAG: YrzI family small protein [Ectobacillus sp.]
MVINVLLFTITVEKRSKSAHEQYVQQVMEEMKERQVYYSL